MEQICAPLVHVDPDTYVPILLAIHMYIYTYIHIYNSYILCIVYTYVVVYIIYFLHLYESE